ncbi:MAG: hypothetical protein BWY63_03655 [Chloroflexi bacterium ADurb.Bin360]|nr:MAG: hypothetical protein BWY63_03655 [Chloroflexi bacterium ADurb.Bin360]
MPVSLNRHSELFGVAVASGGFFCQNLSHQPFEAWWNARVEGGHGGRFLLQVFKRQLVGVFRVEGRHTGQHFIQNNANAIHIGSGRGRLPLDLLWGDVVRTAPDDALVAGIAGVFLKCACDAEIRDLNLPGLRHEHILRFDVAVYQPGSVRNPYRCTDLARKFQGLWYPQWRLSADERFQVLPVDEFHDDVGLFLLRIDLVDANIVNMDNIGVIQPRRGTCFVQEARTETRIAGIRFSQHLDGDGAIQQGVLRLIHQRHAPGAK